MNELKFVIKIIRQFEIFIDLFLVKITILSKKSGLVLIGRINSITLSLVLTIITFFNSHHFPRETHFSHFVAYSNFQYVKIRANREHDLFVEHVFHKEKAFSAMKLGRTEFFVPLQNVKATLTNF